jgi:hypothetical protein
MISQNSCFVCSLSIALEIISKSSRYQVPTHYDMRVTRLRYRHPLEPNFRRVVYQLLSPDNEASRVLVCYEWATEPHLLQVRMRVFELGAAGVD